MFNRALAPPQCKPGQAGCGYLYMNVGTAFAGIAPGQWVDVGPQLVPQLPGDPVLGYFVEYEGAAAAIPEPASWLLLLAGALPLIRRKLR